MFFENADRSVAYRAFDCTFRRVLSENTIAGDRQEITRRTKQSKVWCALHKLYMASEMPYGFKLVRLRSSSSSSITSDKLGED